MKILNLCNVGVCGILELKQAAIAESGISNDIYTLLLDYLETTVSVVQQQTAGENIKFNVGNLNEGYQYTGQIFDSAGNVVPIVIGQDSYDCIKFRTILGLNSDPSVINPTIPPVLNIPKTIVIEDVIGSPYEITGSNDLVVGLDPDSNTIQCAAFAGVRVIVIRGNIPIPGIDPLDGSNFFTKLLGSDFITLSSPLAFGEFIRIQTIPE